MASRAAHLERRTQLLLCSVFALLLAPSGGSVTHSRRLVCWQAILKCHGEPECHYAYDQYLYACASIFHGDRSRSCPSHCISSLIQLNMTRSGPALEDCDCGSDPMCTRTKQAIEPCLPRTSSGLGCTEARRQCEKDPTCSSAMRDYLFHCRKLFGGERCTEECRTVITNMRSMPKAQQLDTCVCDGAERNICEYIKVSMKTFCSDWRFAGSGFSDTEEDSDDDYLDQEEYAYVENSSESAPAQSMLSVITVALVSLRCF